MVDAGYTEIQLLGQNVNSYRDPSGKLSFAELLAAVGGVVGIRRVRFMTSHPRDFTREIVAAIDAVPQLCDHVHLPVQSGSTRVLAAMNREYTREWYLERIAWIKAARREISMTSDIIVGFPGETEAELEETATLLERLGTMRFSVLILCAAEYSGDCDGGFDCGRGEVEACSADGAAREVQRRLCSTPGAGDGGDGGGAQHGARTGGGTQLTEQDGELYGEAAYTSGDGQLQNGEDTETLPNSLVGEAVEG